MDLVPFRRWRPSESRRDVPSLRREMDTFFDRFFRDMPWTGWEGEEWLPSVNVSETDGDIKVKAELPGLEAKDIDISVSGDVLTIKGEKKEEKEEKEEKYYYKEQYSGSFQRCIRLPAEVQSDKVDAKFKNGVLNVVLPKSKESETKKIKVKSE
jgi:HSP20 family protein